MKIDPLTKQELFPHTPAAGCHQSRSSKANCREHQTTQRCVCILLSHVVCVCMCVYVCEIHRQRERESAPVFYIFDTFVSNSIIRDCFIMKNRISLFVCG